jgi:uncharacterized protein GlcG (DUF336 family)
LKETHVHKLTTTIRRALFLTVMAQATGATQAAEAVFTVKMMTPEIALQAARATLDKCRSNGHQISVAIVDRMGVVQVLLRDRFAGPHTPEAAIGKAWTAASFKMPTAAFAQETQPGKPMSGLRSLPRVIAAAGGIPLEAAGTLLGGIGVSGAPGGDADELCAKAGVSAIIDAVDF